MKLNVNFDLLNDEVKKMGAELILDFNTGFNDFQHTNIDKILGTTGGQNIDINDIDVNLDGGGLLEYEGRQVLLFIPEQYNIDKVIDSYANGNKFHISDCVTLQEMKRTNRYNKYAVTNNLSGIFTINGYSNNQMKQIKLESKLNVCRNCLDKLNYKNYRDNKQEVFTNFKINEFFEVYSVLFEYLPNLDLTISESRTNNERERTDTICEICNADFQDNEELLSLNTDRTICLDCYRKQNAHKTTLITKEQLKKIYQIRTNQKIVEINEWNDVYKFLDISLHSYIHIIKTKYPRPPTSIGYVPQENKDIVLDLVWITEDKKSALVANKLPEHGRLTSWTIFTLGEAMEKLSNNTRR